VKVKFEVEALRVLNLPSKLNGREVRLAWSKGKRKSNRGESEAAVVHDGTANLDYRFPIEASMAQDAAQQFESKKIAFYIRVGLPLRSADLSLIHCLFILQLIIIGCGGGQDDKKSKVGKETLDLAAFAKEGQQANHNLALGKKNPPVLMVRTPTPAAAASHNNVDTHALTTHLLPLQLNLKASWLKFNGKFILRCPHNHPAGGVGGREGAAAAAAGAARGPLAANGAVTLLSFVHTR
jgi:hypothetical protein